MALNGQHHASTDSSRKKYPLFPLNRKVNGFNCPNRRGSKKILCPIWKLKPGHPDISILIQTSLMPILKRNRRERGFRYTKSNYFFGSDILRSWQQLIMSGMFRLSWNPKVHHCVWKNKPLVHILSQMNPVNILTTYFFKCILILAPNLRLSLSSGVNFSFLPCVLQTLYTSHPSWCNHCNN
jgi:hypothetical protein